MSEATKQQSWDALSRGGGLQDLGDVRRLEETLVSLRNLLATCRTINDVADDLNKNSVEHRFEINLENAASFEAMHDEVRAFARDLSCVEQQGQLLPLREMATRAEALRAKLMEEETKLIPWGNDHAQLLRYLMAKAIAVWRRDGLFPDDFALDGQTEIEKVWELLRDMRKHLKKHPASAKVSLRARRLLQQWILLARALDSGAESNEDLDDSIRYYRLRFETLRAKLRRSNKHES